MNRFFKIAGFAILLALVMMLGAQIIPLIFTKNADTWFRGSAF